MKSLLISCFVLFFSLNAFAAQEVTDSSTGVSFPAEISFDYQGKNYQLDATGVATRKKLIVKVYSVAHYLQKQAAQNGDKLQQILNDANAKQLTIKWVRDVPLDKALEGYVESFKASNSDQVYEQLQVPFKAYIAFFKQEIKKGDEHVIRWIPGGVIEVQINGKPIGSITNPDFAKALWNIWFGNKSVVNRDNLMSLMK